MITNIHRREFAASAQNLGHVLDTLASDSDLVWPAWRWEPLLLNNGLKVGSSGGHGAIRYRVESYKPGESVVFRFDPKVGIEGMHSFRVETKPGEPPCLVHELTGELSGQMKLLWPLLVRKLHDATIEDCFDTVAFALADHSRPQRKVSFIERQFHAIVNRSPSASSKKVRLVGDFTAVGLLTAGVAHAAWGLGFYWPGHDTISLARKVVGGTVFPVPRDCFIAAVLLAGAAGAVAVRTRPKTTWETNSVGPLSGLFVAAIGVVLAARGIVGLLVSATDLVQTSVEFRRLNLTVYSPLCLLLAAGAFLTNGMLSKRSGKPTGQFHRAHSIPVSGRPAAP